MCRTMRRRRGGDGDDGIIQVRGIYGDARYVDTGEAAVAPLQPALAQAPTGFAWWLCGLEYELAPPKEIAILGENPQPLLDVVFSEYRPNQVVAYGRDEEAESGIPRVCHA